MKWKNRGHEYDDAWYSIKEKDIYIWGAGKTGKRILKYFNNMHIKAFLDSDQKISKRGGHLGTPILYTGDILDKLDNRKSCIIISLGGDVGKKIEEDCKKRGWIPGKNVFIADSEFLSYEMPKLYAYALNKTYFYAVTMNITELCTLRCKDCLMCMPYIQSPKHELPEDMINDVDILFDSVDMIAYLQLIGGEPLLYPYLDSLIEYLHRNYKDKYGEIVIYTNGTIFLNDKLSKLFKELEVKVHISDYSNVSERVKQKQAEFAKDLKEKEIDYSIMKAEKWFDYGLRRNKVSDKNEEEMIEFFDRCRPGCWTIHHGKLYYCYPGRMAQKIRAIEEDGTNYIDLRNPSKLSCYEMVEWYEGYSEQGYPTVCRLCNGQSDKTCSIAVAEQINE